MSRFLKKLLKFVVFILLCILGVYIGFQLAQMRRPVDSSRMEQCLKLYKIYRADTDQEKLARNLSKISLTPNDFQQIIDRFILYRTQKSAMQQGMKLLKAFRMGFNIEVDKVYSISGMENEPFRLDAEILAVFEKNPQLIKDAFEG